MAQYLLSVHTPVDEPQLPMSDEEMREGFGRIGALEDEMRSAGALLSSGRLEAPSAAAVVRVSDGKTLTTDGPFVESKEILGGFYIIEAPTRDAALAWGAKTAAAIEMPIEVRAFRGFRS